MKTKHYLLAQKYVVPISIFALLLVSHEVSANRDQSVAQPEAVSLDPATFFELRPTLNLMEAIQEASCEEILKIGRAVTPELIEQNKYPIHRQYFYQFSAACVGPQGLNWYDDLLFTELLSGHPANYSGMAFFVISESRRPEALEIVHGLLEEETFSGVVRNNVLQAIAHWDFYDESFAKDFATLYRQTGNEDFMSVSFAVSPTRLLIDQGIDVASRGKFDGSADQLAFLREVIDRPPASMSELPLQQRKNLVRWIIDGVGQPLEKQDLHFALGLALVKLSRATENGQMARVPELVKMIQDAREIAEDPKANEALGHALQLILSDYPV